MSFFRALGAGYLYVRASAVEAKGNSRLKTENGPLGRRDRAKWNRSKVTPLNKWPYGTVTALCSLHYPHHTCSNGISRLFTTLTC